MNTVTETTCIDFHAHALPQAFRNAVAELGIDPIAEDGFPLPAWSIEAHLQFMAERLRAVPRLLAINQL